jgi:two-component SAPR family response regulator
MKNSVRIIAQNSPSHIESTSELIFDTISNRLVLYSLDYNYLSVFDFEAREWSPHDPGTGNLTVYWHHNRLMAPDGSIIAFGGYGEFMYKNSVLAWNPEKSRFDSVGYKGDFHPRYLAGSGFNPGDSLLYIIGGYGSESGKQSESPDYYYEILSFSFEDSTFSKVVEFPNTQVGFCFANSVVFDDSNNMYALYYSKYHFSNKLQLVRIPLENPEIIELGNALDYSFLDVHSFADLHFSKRSNALVAVSSYSSNGKTMVSVHSIAFPPQTFSIEATPAEKNISSVALYFIAAFILIVSAYLLYYHRTRRSASERKPAAKPRETIQRSMENSIILFGGFQVINQKGKDITGQFTPLPKKLFLFILLHSLRNDKGVSSDVLYETFWFDKSVESARNNRAVNIVKLKFLLKNLETASISKETGYWKFDFDPSRIYIDYFEYLQIVRCTIDLTKEHIVDLLSIIENRPFLPNTNADWLDPFKSEISNDIIDTFLRYIGRSDDNPEFLLHLSNCIFLFDAVNEEALKFQCRLLIKQGKHSLAKKAYSKFINEYRQLYDEEYGMNFDQIIEEK